MPRFTRRMIGGRRRRRGGRRTKRGGQKLLDGTIRAPAILAEQTSAPMSGWGGPGLFSDGTRRADPVFATGAPGGGRVQGTAVDGKALSPGMGASPFAVHNTLQGGRRRRHRRRTHRKKHRKSRKTRRK